MGPGQVGKVPADLGQLSSESTLVSWAPAGCRVQGNRWNVGGQLVCGGQLGCRVNRWGVGGQVRCSGTGGVQGEQVGYGGTGRVQGNRWGIWDQVGYGGSGGMAGRQAG